MFVLYLRFLTQVTAFPSNWFLSRRFFKIVLYIVIYKKKNDPNPIVPSPTIWDHNVNKFEKTSTMLLHNFSLKRERGKHTWSSYHPIMIGAKFARNKASCLGKEIQMWKVYDTNFNNNRQNLISLWPRWAKKGITFILMTSKFYV